MNETAFELHQRKINKWLGAGKEVKLKAHTTQIIEWFKKKKKLSIEN